MEKYPTKTNKNDFNWMSDFIRKIKYHILYIHKNAWCCDSAIYDQEWKFGIIESKIYTNGTCININMDKKNRRGEEYQRGNGRLSKNVFSCQLILLILFI